MKPVQTPRPIKYYGHGLLRNRKFAESFLGRKLTPGGRYAEIHHYLDGFEELIIPRDLLNTIPGIDQARLPLCAIVTTEKNDAYTKVLGLHLTESEYAMVKALNFDGNVFQDTFSGIGDSGPLISLLRHDYRMLATRVKHKDGPHAHVYDLLSITEEEMMHLGKTLGDEIAKNLGLPRTTVEGTQTSPEGRHHHGHGKERG